MPAAKRLDGPSFARRGRRRGGAHPPPATRRSSASARDPSPRWFPSDASLDPARVSRLVARAHAPRHRLYRRRLLDSPLRRRVGPTHLSLLGVGSFESSPAARLQLALLRLDLLPDAAPAELFDPVLSAAERAEGPTFSYMPHREASLYDALLAANLGSPAQLRRDCVLGDSFRRYALQAEDSRSGPAARAAVHVLAAERFACEERVGVTRDPDQDDWFARAFNETSWHSFLRGGRRRRLARLHCIAAG